MLDGLLVACLLMLLAVAGQAAELKEQSGKVSSLLGYSSVKDRELRELRAELDRQREAWALERKLLLQQTFAEQQTLGSLAALGKLESTSQQSGGSGGGGGAGSVLGGKRTPVML